jgi:uncharacterized protein DUF3987
MTPIPPLPGKPSDALRKPSTARVISFIMQALQRLPRDEATEELFREVTDRVKSELPPGRRPGVLSTTIASAFGKSIEEVDLVLKQSDRRTEFDSLVPTAGWIRDYIEWTRQTEPPTVFHFFVAAATIGATLGRNVLFDKGAYKVYPNLWVMIIAPTGSCRKTSACNLGTGLYVKAGGTLLGGDKPTPEALVDSLKDSPNAVGLLYAPELAVFLGKQKYQEGMVPLLTALSDCPDLWSSKTIGRGEISLTNVGLSSIFCSTIDWIQTGIAKDAFGGGFMSRFLFIVQESTPRSFPLPPPLNDEVRKSLIGRLQGYRHRRGRFTMSPEAEAWYTLWYRAKPSLGLGRQYAGYYERKPDHLIRLAMILWVAEHGPTVKDLILGPQDLQRAENILRWLEDWLPATFDEMTSTASGEDQQRILRHLKHAGGTMEYSSLLRKNSSKMNAEQFKRSMATLREAKLVEWDGTTRTYFLTTEGWQ